MQFGGWNFLGIVVAAAAILAIGLLRIRLGTGDGQNGGLWQRPGHVAVLAILSLLMATVMAGTLGHLGPGQVTARNGLVTAGFLWIGVALPVTLGHALARSEPLIPAIKEALWWLPTLALAGLIVGGVGAET